MQPCSLQLPKLDFFLSQLAFISSATGHCVSLKEEEEEGIRRDQEGKEKEKDLGSHEESVKSTLCRIENLLFSFPACGLFLKQRISFVRSTWF